MKREESDFLISKKEMEGKSAKQIIFELKRLEGTRVELKENQKEINILKNNIEKLDKQNSKLKNQNFKMGLNVPEKTIIKISEYHNVPFPSESKVKRIKMCVRSFENPVRINEIKDLCGTMTLGHIRDCLMILCHLGVVILTKDNKFQMNRENLFK